MGGQSRNSNEKLEKIYSVLVKNFVALTSRKLEVTLSNIVSSFYLRGTYIDDRDAPIPGEPCLTGLFVMANSPK
jgi:hypothetical protein